MENRVSFQFDPNLDYQMDAVRSVVDLFKGLPKQPSGLYQNTKKKLQKVILFVTQRLTMESDY